MFTEILLIISFILLVFIILEQRKIRSTLLEFRNDKDEISIKSPSRVDPSVYLRDELVVANFKSRKGKLKIPLGRNMLFESCFLDLCEAPHLLIAGATNSGKSRFFHSMLASLMLQYGPKELRFILADPKRVEFPPYYCDSPYLEFPVITDYSKVVEAVRWCTDEMDRRFEILSKSGKLTIQEYNNSNDEWMSFIVFAIDEMSDFSVTDENGELFDQLIKIFQMGRTVGIHFVAGTSRPCDEVFPEIFRANVPARIAFSTATSENSMIILDQKGAEKLLGRGDALYINAGTDKPMRIQTPLITDEEIDSLVNSIRKKGYNHDPKNSISLFLLEGDSDKLLEEAREIVISEQKVSVSLLQRKLRIGYARAVFILDALEEAGVIGSTNGSKLREVIKNKPQEN